MLRKKFWFVLLVLVISFTAIQPVAAAPDLAPLVATDSPTAIANRYIVVFAPDTAASEVDKAIDSIGNTEGVAIHYRYSSALVGFAATLSSNAVETLRKNTDIAYIEADQVMTIVGTQSPATWGIDRIDQRNLPLSNSYTYNYTGNGVNVYIIDTGIRFSHNEFGGRAYFAYDSVGDGRNGVDCNGHGTHVAGTVGGSTYGVAKGVSLYAVRVLNCSGSGTTSGVIAGVDWVTAHHQSPAVANMSLGGKASTSLDTAVSNSIASGVVYSLAAGNERTDACRKSPARVTEGLTVGATTSTDARASYSNYGACLDLFAPGSSITSAWYSSDTATNTISGTSMAAPHVAGVAALYLDAHPGATVSQVNSAIVNNATAGVVGDPGRKSPNLLLYSLLP
jgi:subtilisin family serine protease